MRKAASVLIMVAAFGFMALPLLGAPSLVSYQGVLTDTGGNPVADDLYGLTFAIYDTAEAGSALWTEVHTDVQVTDGLFHVLLGGGPAPLTPTLFDGDARWLGVSVEGTEMSPRSPISSVPWAFRSSHADSVPALAVPGILNDAANPVDWTKLKSIPSDLADGDQIGVGGVGDGHSLDAVDGAPVNAVFVDSSGQVGIGTESPGEMLDVAGVLETDGFRMPADPATDFVLTSDDSLGNASWQPAYRPILLSKWVDDWDADNEDALNSAIAAVQDADAGWSVASVRHSGGDVVILDVPDDEVLKLGAPVAIPGTKSVKLMADGPRGARIEYTGPGNYAISVAAGNRQVQFENIVFWKGGVELAYGVKGVRFSDCHFDGINDYGIKALGQSVIDVVIRDCLFHDCAGGVSVDFANCDAWVISNCLFWRNSTSDIVINTTGVLVEDCDFEVRSGSLSAPYIHINGGGSYVHRCRFGNEVAGWGEPPTSIIVVGPLGGGTSGTITDVEIVGCKFLGRVGGPTSTSAKHAILFNKQPNGSRVAGNRISEHYGDGIAGTPCCNSAYTDFLIPRVNYWTDNRAYNWGSKPVTAAEWGILATDWIMN